MGKRGLGWGCVQGGVACAISVWGVGGVAVERGRGVGGFEGKRQRGRPSVGQCRAHTSKPSAALFAAPSFVVRAWRNVAMCI